MKTTIDGVKATGGFYMEVIEVATGRLLEKYDNPNKVVTLGHTNVAKLLGGDLTGLAITKIAFGTNGTAPELSDTALTGSYSKAIDSVTYPTSNSVRFNWDLDAGEGNGMTIQELGLLTSTNVLFARKVRSGIVKTSAVRLVGSWTISIN